MDLRILHDGLPLQAHAVEVLRSFFVDVLREMDMGPDDLQFLLVADDAHFAEAVRFAGGDRYTHSDNLIAAAKVVSRLQGEEVCSSLIIHTNVLGAIVQHLDDSTAVETWPAFEQLCFYVPYHELGHVRDAKLRHDFTDVPLTRQKGGFEIGQVAHYYGQILQGEYAACVHSAPWMTVAAYEHEQQEMYQRITSFVAECNHWKARYAFDRSLLNELAFSVAGQSWFLLIQSAKQTASCAHSPVLAARSVVHPKDVGVKDIHDLLQTFGAELLFYWQHYPNWPDQPAFFLRAWYALGTKVGFHFREDVRGSAVLW